MARIQTHLNDEFSVEVQHRRPLPKRYTWEIHRNGVCLSLEESRGEFGSWEEASQDGNAALKQYLERANPDPVGFLRGGSAPTLRKAGDRWKPETNF
jgi:hypothetical protein